MVKIARIARIVKIARMVQIARIVKIARIARMIQIARIEKRIYREEWCGRGKTIISRYLRSDTGKNKVADFYQCRPIYKVPTCVSTKREEERTIGIL